MKCKEHRTNNKRNSFFSSIEMNTKANNNPIFIHNSVRYFFFVFNLLYLLNIELFKREYILISIDSAFYYANQKRQIEEEDDDE